MLGHEKRRRSVPRVLGLKPWHAVKKYLELAALFREVLRRKAVGPEQLAAFLKSIEHPPHLVSVLLIPDKVSGAKITNNGHQSQVRTVDATRSTLGQQY